MAITRIHEDTLADAWANDDGQVVIEVDGHSIPLEPNEARELVELIMTAANDADLVAMQLENPA
ncbi:hypothetical protein [Gryllotalpicola protaetiae]|uniref:Uncharacterized protein n=1 Tax=Gryllotalpicola protaetiae TaxID=2419771 RepID=A0A387BMY4_9MICO|nr:hypothetical protein [Gryllotalpicola protaetiae]AYG02390.1 hypothetical protein D7I44_01795 [Gryllotalpicola protaetiae]